MKWLDNIKTRTGNYILHRSMLRKKHRCRALNFDDARSFGILFNAMSKEDFETVMDFVRYLKSERKKVKVLGYFDIKRYPEGVNSTIDFDYITRKDFNWYFKPVSTKAKNFANEQYDVLIDLSIENCLPLQYLCGTSNGSFRIGKFSPERRIFYDFMINLEEELEMRYFIKQIHHYLKQINNKKL